MDTQVYIKDINGTWYVKTLQEINDKQIKKAQKAKETTAKIFIP